MPSLEFRWTHPVVKASRWTNTSAWLSLYGCGRNLPTLLCLWESKVCEPNQAYVAEKEKIILHRGVIAYKALWIHGQNQVDPCMSSGCIRGVGNLLPNRHRYSMYFTSNLQQMLQNQVSVLSRQAPVSAKGRGTEVRNGWPFYSLDLSSAVQFLGSLHKAHQNFNHALSLSRTS